MNWPVFSICFRAATIPRAKGDQDAPDRFDQDDIGHLKALYEQLAKIAIHAGALRRVVAAHIALEATADVEIVAYPASRLANGDEVFIERASQLSGSNMWKVRARFSCLNTRGE